jgi:hypothetical protein
MLLENLYLYKDLYQSVVHFLSYDDIISLSVVQRSIASKHKKLIIHENIQSIIQEKFKTRKNKKLILTYEDHTDLIDYLMKDQDTFLLNRRFYRELYIKNNLHNGDILVSPQSNYYILHRYRIWNTNFQNGLCYIPKPIQTKYKWTHWDQFENNVEAYVTITVEDFCLDNVICLNGDLRYVLIYNTKLDGYIMIYLYHHYLGLEFEVKQKLKERLESIFQKSHFLHNRNSEMSKYYCETNDVLIFRYKNTKQWYIE